MYVVHDSRILQHTESVYSRKGGTKMNGGNKQDFIFDFDLDPYQSFMRNHLKHYGYYTGRNESYRSSARAFDEWDCTHGYALSDQGSDTEYENQALKDDKDSANLQEEKRTTQLTFKYHAGKMVPRLREPRHLYAQSKDGGSQQAPRWPADMEVLPDRVCHIPYVPKEREKFYQPSGYEKMPQPSAEGEGRVVYFCPPTKEAYFLRSRVGGSRSGCPMRAVKIKTPEDITLIFESRFESGNLMKVTQVSEYDYELQLRYDLYTNKHTQWFYFRIQNMRQGVKYRFTITNFMKPGSLYNDGMRPLLYSEIDAQKRNVGWRRAGEDIKYYKNYLKRSDGKCERNFYSLTWTCVFPHDNDVCYFAHCYPYTYSDLQDYLLNLSNDPVCSKFCKLRILCRSLAGNIVHILTITSPAKNPEDAKMKKAVVLTARVHPGETNSSWMMKGFLDFLVGSSADAKLLRDTFVFKIVPMLNPDGVIVGNYRCSLAGRDLNRNYKSVLKDSFPSVSHTKLMIKKLMEEREVSIYCDLHGHSRKQNVFIYGCENKDNPKRRLRERIFPVIMGRNAADKFSYDICKFKVQKSKEGTGRVVVWQMGIMNSYTMEATFCGSTLDDKLQGHFTTADYEAMGYHFCDTILDYFDPSESKCDQILSDLEEKLRQQILRHLERTGSPLPADGIIDLSEDYSSALESSTTGSDSSVDDGLPVHLLALAPKLNKKKKLKTRKERDKKRSSLEKTKEKEEEKKPSTPKKDNQKMKYRHMDRSTLHSAGKTRSVVNKTGDGMPVFAQERCEEKNIKKTEYLEALTNAYLMSGVLKPSQDVPSFRYSAGSASLSASGVPMAHMDGLCPHHEKALAQQYVANQLAGLQFTASADNWNRCPAEPETTVEVVPHANLSPFQHRNFNNHMVTMNALQQQQRPLNEYIRQAAQHIKTRPQTGKRSRIGSASPIKTHPSPFDEQSEGSMGHQSTPDIMKRGASIRDSRSPSATTFAVYDGRSYGSLLGQERPSSKQSVQGSSDSVVDSTQQPVASPTASGLISETGRGSSVNSPQVNSESNCSNQRTTTLNTVEAKDLSKGSKGETEIRRYCVPTPVSSSKAPTSSKRHESPVSKIHRCSTEATPITDTSAFTLQQRNTKSSHHFHKAQNFYSGSLVAHKAEQGTAVGPSPSRTDKKGQETGGSSGIRSKQTGSPAENSTGYRMSVASLKKAGLIGQNYANMNNNAEETLADGNCTTEDISENKVVKTEEVENIQQRQRVVSPVVAEKGDNVSLHYKQEIGGKSNSDTETDSELWKEIRKPKTNRDNLRVSNLNEKETLQRTQQQLRRRVENRAKSASQRSTMSNRSEPIISDSRFFGSNHRNSVQNSGIVGRPVMSQPSTRPLSSSSLRYTPNSVKNVNSTRPTVDSMQKYKPATSNEETAYTTVPVKPFPNRPQTPGATSVSMGNQSMKGQQPIRRNNLKHGQSWSPKNLSRDLYDDDLYAERVISPQSTNKFVHVQQLALQMRGFGIAPSSDQGGVCDGGSSYHIVMEGAESVEAKNGQKNSESVPARLHSAKSIRSPLMHDPKSQHDDATHAIDKLDVVVEFQGGFQGNQKSAAMMRYARKK
ncbi:uncharacterized protein LOC110975422 isoform X3 [Acanthaster planci]|uniref:Uncharacterized protein LOC110975422 isoform X3 n=1 Tax=Acanthaster planci TaxID=133434 RepID=A0A8B7XTP8_ACAPL|nr:uncharacterized protein LOC110975422 isoform X3 [Acanthaster planci]